MISKLPTWVWGIACGLAAIAGMINVIGLMGFDHQAVTHMTGSMSIAAEALVSHDIAHARHVLAIIGAFVAGTVVSGLLIKDSVLQLGRRYGIALILETFLLYLAMTLLNAGDQRGMYFAASACGLQNAMMTTYSGTIIRTTHISGMATDLGITLGHWMRGLPVDHRRVRLCISVIMGFFVGGVVGAALFNQVGYGALWLPILMTAFCAIGYATWRSVTMRTAE